MTAVPDGLKIESIVQVSSCRMIGLNSER